MSPTQRRSGSSGRLRRPFVQGWSVSYTDCVGFKELKVRTYRARAVLKTSPKELEIGWYSTLAVPELSTKELQSKAHRPLNPLESSAVTVQYTVLSPPNAVQSASVVLYTSLSPPLRTAGVTETESGQCDRPSQESLICPLGPRHSSPRQPTFTHCAPEPPASRSSTLAPLFRTPQVNQWLQCLSDVYYKPRIQWTSSTLKKVPSSTFQLPGVCVSRASLASSLLLSASSWILCSRLSIPGVCVSRKLSTCSPQALYCSPPPPGSCVHGSQSQVCVCHVQVLASSQYCSPPPPGSCVHGSQSQVCVCHVQASSQPALRLLLDPVFTALNPTALRLLLDPVFTALNPRCVCVTCNPLYCSPPPPGSCVHGSQSQVCVCHVQLSTCSPPPPGSCVHGSQSQVCVCHVLQALTALRLLLDPVFTALNPRCVCVTCKLSTALRLLLDPVFTALNPRCVCVTCKSLQALYCSPPPPGSCVHGSQSQVCVCHVQALYCSPPPPGSCVHGSQSQVCVCHVQASSQPALRLLLDPVFTALNPRCVCVTCNPCSRSPPPPGSCVHGSQSQVCVCHVQVLASSLLLSASSWILCSRLSIPGVCVSRATLASSQPALRLLLDPVFTALNPRCFVSLLKKVPSSTFQLPGVCVSRASSLNPTALRLLLDPVFTALNPRCVCVTCKLCSPPPPGSCVQALNPTALRLLLDPVFTALNPRCVCVTCKSLQALYCSPPPPGSCVHGSQSQVCVCHVQALYCSPPPPGSCVHGSQSQVCVCHVQVLASSQYCSPPPPGSCVHGSQSQVCVCHVQALYCSPPPPGSCVHGSQSQVCVCHVQRCKLSTALRLLLDPVFTALNPRCVCVTCKQALYCSPPPPGSCVHGSQSQVCVCHVQASSLQALNPRCVCVCSPPPPGSCVHGSQSQVCVCHVQVLASSQPALRLLLDPVFTALNPRCVCVTCNPCKLSTCSPPPPGSCVHGSQSQVFCVITEESAGPTWRTPLGCRSHPSCPSHPSEP